MLPVTFTVTCDGCNPIPYKRTTQRQKFVDNGYKKYLAWKELVYWSFVKQIKKQPSKVFKSGEKYYAIITVYYMDKTHGDTDNVTKGILDAIFQKPLTDKFIAGFFDYFYDKKNPRVEVTFLTDIQTWKTS